jgi:hypothetical protein
MGRALTDWQKELIRAARTTLPAQLRQAAVSLALHAEGMAKRSVTSGGASGLQVRSGLLRGSITGTVRDRGAGAHIPTALQKPGDFEIVLRADARYSSTHENGGTITPKRGQYLAIPLGPAKTAAGVSRYASPRMVPDLFVIRTATGKLLLVKGERPPGAGPRRPKSDRKPKLGPKAPRVFGPVRHRGPVRQTRLTAYFLLVRSVTVPARPFVKPAIEDARRLMPSQIRAALERAVAANRGGG